MGGSSPSATWRSLLYQGRGELDIVSQVDSIDSIAPLLTDLDRLTQALAVAEAIDQLAMDREPAPHLYRMLVGVLRTLETSPSPLVVPAFFWKLLAAEGTRPELDACVRCGEEANLVAFDMEEGGVLCRSCRRGVAVSAEALRLSRMILGGRMNEAFAEPASGATAEVAQLAMGAFEHLIERRLRSVAIFERH